MRTDLTNVLAGKKAVKGTVNALNALSITKQASMNLIAKEKSYCQDYLIKNDIIK